jgi:hypothetical protein
MGFSDLEKAPALLAVSADPLAVEIQRTTSDGSAFELDSPHAGTNPFYDQAALQFSNRTDDDDDGSSQRSTGVDLFAEADELDVQSVEIIEDIEEVPSGACDAIARPDQDNIELAAASISHHPIESRPLGLSPGNPIGKFLDDLIATLISHLPEIEKLGFRVLIDCRHPHIDSSALHARLLFFFGAGCLLT